MSCRPNDIRADLVRHDRQRCEERDADEVRKVIEPLVHERRVRRRDQNEKRQAPPHHDRTSAIVRITAFPKRSRRVDHVDEEQKQTERSEPGPHPGRALGNGNRLAAKKVYLLDRSNFAVVDVGDDGEVDDQQQQPQSENRPGQPPSAGVEVDTDKADDARDRHEDRNVSPAHGGAVVIRRQRRAIEISPAAMPATAKAISENNRCTRLADCLSQMRRWMRRASGTTTRSLTRWMTTSSSRGPVMGHLTCVSSNPSPFYARLHEIARFL